MGRHASGSGYRRAAVRGIPLVGRRGRGTPPRHAGRAPGGPRGVGAVAGLALLAGSIFGLAGLQTPRGTDPPGLVEPASPPPRPAGAPPSAPLAVAVEFLPPSAPQDDPGSARPTTTRRGAVSRVVRAEPAAPDGRTSGASAR